MSCVSTLNDNQAKEQDRTSALKKTDTEPEMLYIHIIIRHETQGGWWILGSCVKQRLPLGQRRRVSHSNLSPCAALPGGATAAAVCLPHLKDSISSLWGKNKASSSSADQNCSAQITFMKYLLSLAGEISILMAHQAQLSQIMKIHFHCQSAAVWVGLAPSRLAGTKTCHYSGFLITNAHFPSQLIH